MTEDGQSGKRTALIEWLASSDTYSAAAKNFHQSQSTPKFSLVQLAKTGSKPSVVATAAIAAGEILLTSSGANLLSHKTSSIREHISKKELELLPPWLSLVLTILYEHGQGNSSKWWPLLDLLPIDFDTLMYWSEEELRELAGSHLPARIGKADAEESFRGTLFPILLVNSSIFGSYENLFSTLREPMSQELALRLVHRFATIVSMDSIDLEDDEEEHVNPEPSTDEDELVEDMVLKALVPLTTFIQSDPLSCNVQLINDEDGSISVTATKAIENGDEVIQDPGEIPNGELLRNYGILAGEENPFDVADLDLKTIRASAPAQGLSESQIENREALADRWDILDDGYDLVRSPSTNGMNPDLLLMASLFSEALDTNFEELKAVKKKPKGKLDRGNATLLLTACEKRQKRYPTTLAEDLTALQNTPDLPLRKQMAIRVRLSEKQILADHVAYLRDVVIDVDDVMEIDSRGAKRQKT